MLVQHTTFNNFFNVFPKRGLECRRFFCQTELHTMRQVGRFFVKRKFTLTVSKFVALQINVKQ